MISKELVEEAFGQAADAVRSIEDAEYRKIAFQIVFSKALDLAPVRDVVPATPRAPSARDLSGAMVAQRMSLNEFLAKVRLSSYVDRVVAIAYYFFHGAQQDAVTRQELLATFKKSRMAPPKNISDVVAQCIRKGMLVDAEPKEGQKAWAITQTGERFVEERLRPPE